jgi:hypothetical protein
MPIYWTAGGAPGWIAWVLVGSGYLLYLALTSGGCNGDAACIAAVNDMCSNGGCF